MLMVMVSLTKMQTMLMTEPTMQTQTNQLIEEAN